MLVEFRVRNFRSLRDEQVLSLVAAKDKSLVETNTVSSGINAVPSLIRSAVIYGANASGKSNLIKALQYMRNTIALPAVLQSNQPFNVQPFRLDTTSNDQPMGFEVTFIIDGVRYQYGFELTQQRVNSEHLLVYKAFKPQQWFKRIYDPITGQDRYHFGAGLAGQKSVWEKSTRPNALFLSTAVQLNSDQLRPVFDWFTKQLIIFNEMSPLNPQFSADMLRQQDQKRAICDFLATADISISDINVVANKVMTQSLNVDFSTGKTEFKNVEQEMNEVQFHHETKDGKAIFGLGDESTGTQRLLFLTGPMLDFLKHGTTVLIDELDSSLHPLLVRRLVSLFHSPEINPKGAQLIFCTHDTSLLDINFFRRDQIWFVEKNHEQATTLYALTDFSPRKNENLERGYLMGRYGALPFFRDWPN